MVKANAYGAGAAEVAQTLFENGVYYLAVATLSEALELRENSDVTKVLVMGYTPDEYLISDTKAGQPHAIASNKDIEVPSLCEALMYKSALR